MDIKKFEEAKKLVSLIEGAERSVERLQNLFDTEEIMISRKEGGHAYATGKKKDAIKEIMVGSAQEWLDKQKKTLEEL
ncbi:hypothetical protein ACRC6Q_16685 [Planococcus sp. SE5232]|uniref:hypothetical protein n=1 Tax=unclassified Planococcus (in: firmicutes) TaxID=2662419 RepID=UPI003D6C09D0